MIAKGTPPSEQSLTPASLRETPLRLQADRVRRYVRGGKIDDAATLRDLDEWSAWFGPRSEPALLVLLLELLRRLPDPRVLAIARGAVTHRGDGVRLEALRILFDRLPGETEALALRHRDDRSLEVRVLVASRLLAVDRAQAVDLAFAILEEEAGGVREHHALERISELLVEAGGSDVTRRLRALQPELHDPENFVGWALDAIERAER